MREKIDWAFKQITNPLDYEANERFFLIAMQDIFQLGVSVGMMAKEINYERPDNFPEIWADAR